MHRTDLAGSDAWYRTRRVLCKQLCNYLNMALQSPTARCSAVSHSILQQETVTWTSLGLLVAQRKTERLPEGQNVECCCISSCHLICFRERRWKHSQFKTRLRSSWVKVVNAQQGLVLFVGIRHLMGEL